MQGCYWCSRRFVLPRGCRGNEALFGSTEPSRSHIERTDGGAEDCEACNANSATPPLYGPSFLSLMRQPAVSDRPITHSLRCASASRRATTRASGIETSPRDVILLLICYEVYVGKTVYFRLPTTWREKSTSCHINPARSCIITPSVQQLWYCVQIRSCTC